MQRTKTLGEGEALIPPASYQCEGRPLRPLFSSFRNDLGVSNSEHDAELDAAGGTRIKQMWPLPASHLEPAREGARH